MPYIFFKISYLLIRERERDINLLFHLCMHSLVDSCMCPDQRSNPQPRHYWDDALTNWATQPGPNICLIFYQNLFFRDWDCSYRVGIVQIIYISIVEVVVRVLFKKMYLKKENIDFLIAKEYFYNAVFQISFTTLCIQCTDCCIFFPKHIYL